MDAWNVAFVARHQFRQLRRNRLFEGYFLFAYGVTLWLQLTGQTELFVNTLQQSPAFIPYLNAYLFAVFAVVPVVVLGNDAFCRSRRLDSLEAVYYRPESNAEYVAGVALGFLGALGAVYAVFWVSALTLHALFSEAPVSLGLYVFYPLTIVVPGVVFALGLTFLVSQAVAYRLLALLVLMGAFVLLVGYGGEMVGGVLDPLGLSLPAAWSEFTGLADAGGYLAQRGCWLALGVGCLVWSVSAFRRLPNCPRGVWRRSVAASCLVAGVLLGGVFVWRHEGRLVDRRAYKEAYKRYASAPKATAVAHAIDFRQEGNRLAVVSELTVANGTGEALPEVLLYLNPGLEVTSVREGNAPLVFGRDAQVVRVSRRMEAGDTLRLRVEYAGEIDEAVCHVNVAEDTWSNTRRGSEMCMRYGKRYAYVERGYTLLTPGALWYPTMLPPENPSSVYDAPVDFTRFSLRVRNPERQTVISQGRRSGTPEDILFRDEHPLPGISLCMGDYSTRRITVDSVTYEINLLRGHEYVLKPYYDARFFEIRPAVRKARRLVEQTLGKSYPYSRIILVETPVHFTSYYQSERGASQYVQPELVLGKEYGRNWLFRMADQFGREINCQEFLKSSVWNPSFSWKDYLQSWEMWKTERVLLRFLRRGGKMNREVEHQEANPMSARALFYDYVSYFHSVDFPFFNVFMQTILRDNNVTSQSGRGESDKDLSIGRELMVSYFLRTRSFEDVFADSTLAIEVLEPILLLESREFLNRLMVEGVSVDSVRNFTLAYLAERPFRVVDFEGFAADAFQQRFGVDMKQVLSIQYKRKGLPSYIVEPLGEDVVPGDLEVRFSRFRVYNDSDVDGFIHVEKSIPVDDGSPFGWNKRTQNYQYVAYELKAHTGIEVRTRTYGRTTLNTNLADNVPGVYSIDFAGYTDDTSQYVRSLPKEAFLPPGNELIVDNVDDGCAIKQTEQTWVERWKEVDMMPWEKYCEVESWLNTTRWRELVSSNAWGTPLRTCLFKGAGRGLCAVEWHVQIPQAGEYEIWVYIPDLAMFDKDAVQLYTIKQNGWKEMVELGSLYKDGWMALGRFYCQEGECVVSLSDEGKETQIIYADAVKWVRENE